MNIPKVSVIIPTYNRSQRVCRAIDSVLSQDYENMEVIVVDDGSTDDTSAVLKAYGGQIKVISLPNGGVGRARNTGLQMAAGDYLNLLDSDDFLLPGKISAQAAYLSEHPEIDIVLCGWRMLNEEEGNSQSDQLDIPVNDLARAILWSDIHGLFPPHAPMLRRSCLGRLQGFDTTLPVREEQDFWLRAAVEGFRFGLIARVLCVYVNHAGSKGKNFSKLEETMPVILNKVFSHPHLSPEIAAIKEEIYARNYLHICELICWETALTTTQKMDTARRLSEKAFRGVVDINTWHSDTTGRFLYTVLSLGLQDPELALRSALPMDTALRVRENLLSRLYQILAFQAFENGNRAGVLQSTLRAIRHNGRVFNKGLASIFLQSLVNIHRRMAA